MLGFRYFKFQPSQYVLRYKNGKLVRHGAGLAFTCCLRNTTLAVLPVSSVGAPFIFEETTADFQTVTVQGEIVYRITQPALTAQMLDYSIDLRTGAHRSDDPQKLGQRIINSAKVIARRSLEQTSLKNALRQGEQLSAALLAQLLDSGEMQAIGVEVLSVALLDLKANKETGRALEADTRERVLRQADDAVYERRNASIEQERRVQENEYNTEISAEAKKREVHEKKLEAEGAVQARRAELETERLLADIRLEEKRRELVELRAENARAEADANAYALSASMRALEGVDSQVLQALASVDMQPAKLMAMAFQDLAGNAEKIGQLNITPDLLREILQEDACTR